MCVYPSFLFFWVINMLIYIHIIKTVEARRNFAIVGSWQSQIRCQTVQATPHNSMEFLSVMVI